MTLCQTKCTERAPFELVRRNVVAARRSLGPTLEITKNW